MPYLSPCLPTVWSDVHLLLILYEFGAKVTWGKMKNAELHQKEGTPETHNRNKVRDREERHEQQGWERQVYREPPHRAIQQDFYLKPFFIHLVILPTNAHNFQVASWKSTDTHVLKLPFKFPSVFPTVWVNSGENRRITLKEEKKTVLIWKETVPLTSAHDEARSRVFSVDSARDVGIVGPAQVEVEVAIRLQRSNRKDGKPAYRKLQRFIRRQSNFSKDRHLRWAVLP